LAERWTENPRVGGSIPPPAILVRIYLWKRAESFILPGLAETQAPPPLPKSQPSFGRRHSTIIKLLGVGALVLVLLIPLMMITGRVERSTFATE
jgi:hypothetical protein